MNSCDHHLISLLVVLPWWWWWKTWSSAPQCIWDCETKVSHHQISATLLPGRELCKCQRPNSVRHLRHTRGSTSIAIYTQYTGMSIWPSICTHAVSLQRQSPVPSPSTTTRTPRVWRWSTTRRGYRKWPLTSSTTLASWRKPSRKWLHKLLYYSLV